ncbi:PREDICTED: uncharacterized protein LOC109339025 [Lupinus angustifolius]|uniref:uncharacterized protein LOC109339025 n=1 Tax=Lupinus angustifolius TaxID=3871 RepID=UPI00092F5F59|nr:PREDICTED: uncharacterized protein LOC109339025 [Lupinus angustifolius]
MQNWQQTYCCTLTRSTSDHHPVLLGFSNEIPRSQAQFRFLRMWLKHEGLRGVIENHWANQVVGCPMYILSTKLKGLKAILNCWNKEVFGNIHSRVKEALSKVERFQQRITNEGHYDNLMTQEDQAQNELMVALAAEEEFWKEKSRLNWQISGDRNTSYFHNIAKIRYATKSMCMLRQGENTLLDRQEIEHHVLDYFTTLYASDNVTQPSHLIDSVIPKLVSEEDNSMLSKIPLEEEIKGAVFAMNGEGAPGPDGFGGCFFHNFWDIVGKDLCQSVKQFFKQCWILPNLNSNNLVLIPKFPSADKIEDFRPIALANFQFKIITKVLADRLATIAPKIISKQQRGFIKDRHIHDCICIASEAINLLDHKTLGGNLAIKLDVKKAFDTIDWKFLKDTLHAFGGIKRELFSIKDLFNDYAKASDQCLNLSKCKFFSTQATPRKISKLTNWLGFGVGNLPFNYLGVPVFKGKPKAIHLQPIADKIINKLARWKGSCLSIMGRVELVKSIIHSMLLYNFHIYSWPVNLLKKLDCCIRNFIWSGDTKVKKLVTIVWHKVCCPIKESGLGIRSIKLLNQAAMLKLAWEMNSSSQEWANYYRNRFCRNKEPKSSYIKSSIWPGIKKHWHVSLENSIWLLAWMSRNHHEVCQRILRTPIPTSLLPDKLAWQHTSDGILNSKEAYNYIKPALVQYNLCNSIWSISIPPTDDNLKIRGLALPSICNLCRSTEESTDHLFFNCSFAKIIWNWLSFQLGYPIDHTSIKSILCISNAWSPQLKQVLISAVVNSIAIIWHCRNKSRFDNIIINSAQAIQMIKMNTSFTGNFTNLCAKPSLLEFSILRAFKINARYNKAPAISEIIWVVPSLGWVKINSDGAAKGSPGHAGGVQFSEITKGGVWDALLHIIVFKIH